MLKYALVLTTVTTSLCMPIGTEAGPLGKRVLLDNGLVLLLAERHDLPAVAINITIKAGITTEPEGKPGLSSITASLLTQGTSKRSATQISEEIDFIGGSLSTFSGDDFSSINMRILKKDLQTGVEILSDILVNPVFNRKEIARKVTSTLADIKRRKDEPGIVAKETLNKAIFGKHPYGRTDEDIANYLPSLTRDDILAFYSMRYRPNNATISVVGDVTEKEIVALINSSFKMWTNTDRPAPASVHVPSSDLKGTVKINKNLTQANIAMGHLGMSRENPDYYAVMVMNYILGGGGFASRLVDNIRDNRGLAYSVFSAFNAQKESGSFTITMQTKNESANEAIENILKEIDRMRSELVSEKELADAKAYLTGSFPLRIDTYAKIASMLTAVELYNLGLDYPDKYRILIGAITREDVLRVARTYLQPENMIIVVVANLEKTKLKF